MQIPLTLLSVVSSLIVTTSSQSDAASVAAAQLPECAKQCFLVLIPRSPCSITNTTCLCNTPSLEDEVTNCVTANCTVKEALATQNITYTFCNRPVAHIGPRVIGPNIAVTVLTIVAVCLRLLARLPVFGTELWLDDWTIVLSVMTAAAMAGLNIKCEDIGFGKASYALPFDTITKLLFLFYVGEKMYISCVWITKISLLLFYLRVFPDYSFRKKVYVVMVICILSLISFIIATVLECWPVDYSWKSWDGEQHWGKCTNINLQGWTNAVANIAMDLVIIALPLPQLVSLHLPLRKKIFVCFMFSVGFLVTIFSAIRLRTLISFGHRSIIEFDYPSLVLFSLLEAYVGILCACMPGLFVFLRGMSRIARGLDPLEHTRSNYSNDSFERRTNLPARPPDTLKLDMANLAADGQSGDRIL